MSSKRLHTAVLFSKCTGLNDSKEMTAAKYLPDGTTDVIKCNNLTVTPEGKLVKIPELATLITHGSTVTELTAGTRMLIQGNANLSEFNGSAVTAVTNSIVFIPGVKAKYIHTPVDVRIRTGVNNQYKLLNTSNIASDCALGTYAGPPTSKVFSKMPDFNSGFVLGAKLYTANGKFVQFSEDYYYDVFNIADNFIGSKNAVLQAGQIPGCMITVHSDGVTGYFGTTPKDFRKQFFPCEVIADTLWSGFISKVYDHAHVFLCNDGVYALTADGKLSNLTVENTDYVNVLNTSYTAVTVSEGKYLAFGDLCCVEFDFRNKALLTRGTRGITSTCYWNKRQYYGVDNLVRVEVEGHDVAVGSTLQLPFNTLDVPDYKQLRFLYFSGLISGTASITVSNEFGQSVTKDISNLGYVQKYKINGLRIPKAPKLSIEITTVNGGFKLEELSASYNVCSSRS